MKFLRSLVNVPRIARRGLIKNSVRTFVKKNSDSAGKQIKPFCAILTSPKKPQRYTSPDELDEEDLDFRDVFEWLKTSDHFDLRIDTNAFKMSAPADKLKTLVDAAFRLLLYPPFSNESHPETVLLYLTGHGFDREKAKEMEELNCSSPKLDDVGISKKLLEPAAKFLTPEQPLVGLKSGEFWLGSFGSCDLKRLLEPWITALTRSPTMKNKHLIVIADSCYSGRFVEDLKQLALKEGPWNQNGCNVTVQSASSSNGITYNEYFTPCFVHFNRPENRGRLENLKQKWNILSETEKRWYSRHLDFPSPKMVTTMPLDHTMEFLPCIHGFPLTLFRDDGFFKFCFSYFYFTKVKLFTNEKAFQLLSQRNFEIVDFKRSLRKDRASHPTLLE